MVTDGILTCISDNLASRTTPLGQQGLHTSLLILTSLYIGCWTLKHTGCQKNWTHNPFIHRTLLIQMFPHLSFLIFSRLLTLWRTKEDSNHRPSATRSAFQLIELLTRVRTNSCVQILESAAQIWEGLTQQQSLSHHLGIVLLSSNFFRFACFVCFSKGRI